MWLLWSQVRSNSQTTLRQVKVTKYFLLLLFLSFSFSSHPTPYTLKCLIFFLISLLFHNENQHSLIAFSQEQLRKGIYPWRRCCLTLGWGAHKRFMGRAAWWDSRDMDMRSARVKCCERWWSAVGQLSKLDGGDDETLSTVLLVGVDVAGGEKAPICCGRNMGMAVEDGGVVIPDGINGLARPVDGGGLSASADPPFSGDEEVDPFIE